MQVELFKVIKELNALEASKYESLIVRSTPTSPPRDEPTDEPALSQANEAAELIVVSTSRKICKERRRERRASKNILEKANRSPEQKVTAVEEFLANITNQAAAWPRKKARSSQRPARLA